MIATRLLIWRSVPSELNATPLNTCTHTGHNTMMDLSLAGSHNAHLKDWHQSSCLEVIGNMVVLVNAVTKDIMESSSERVFRSSLRTQLESVLERFRKSENGT